MNFIKKRSSMLLLMALIATYAASAQSDSVVTCVSCICKKDATPAGVMLSHVHSKGEWMFSYRYMNMATKGMEQNGNTISNDQIYNQYLFSSDRMSMNMHMLMAMYGVSKKLTLMAMVEYKQTTMNMVGPEGTTHIHNGMVMSSSMAHDMKTSGFGDISLTALYSIINNEKHHVLFSGGISIPTGSVETKGDAGSMYPNQRYPYMMQQGSGTWDVKPGLTYTFKGNKVMASTQLFSTIRTGYNQVGYKLGNELTFNNWVAYQWFPWLSTSLRAEVFQMGSVKGYDPGLYAYTEPSANAANYGGTTVMLYAGANTFFLTNNKIGIEAGLPVYQKSNGIQASIYSNVNLVYSIVF
jgi:hypothetical protein